MTLYRFRALVRFDPAVRAGPASGPPAPTGTLAAHGCRLLQPVSCDEYFPAVIARDEELPSRPAGYAVVTIALADGEAEAFFAPGQRFTIWADGVVDHTIRAQGMIGFGVISGPGSTPVTSDGSSRRDRRSTWGSAALITPASPGSGAKISDG